MNTTDKLAARVADAILQAKEKSGRVIVAIDGRCAAGKTTLAAALAQVLGCDVVPMDHFFLRPEQRTQERLASAGGNVDRERFLDEVILPLVRGDAVSYRRFDCKTISLGETVSLSGSDVCIIEGSYSCHPELREFYDLRIFLTVSPEEQFRRITFRNRDAAEIFRTRWIPLEEKYFSELDVAANCDLCFET